MAGITDTWHGLERDQRRAGGPASDPFQAGYTTCFGIMSEVERGLMRPEVLATSVEAMRNWQPPTGTGPQNPLAQYRSGFLKVCQAAPDFLKKRPQPLSETTTRRTLQRILGGYSSSDLRLADWGIDPDQAERSTLANPVIFSKKQGSTLHFFAILPLQVSEAASLLVGRSDRAHKWETILFDDATVMGGQPNTSGQPYRVKVNFEMPVWGMENRWLEMTVVARSQGAPGDPHEKLEIDLTRVPDSGNIKQYRAQIQIRRVGPDRVFYTQQVTYDLNVRVPRSLLEKKEHELLEEFKRDLSAFGTRRTGR